ncbi:MAG: hypothetical protein ACOCZV_01345, partial [Nanoarchaeota archaeon]
QYRNTAHSGCVSQTEEPRQTGQDSKQNTTAVPDDDLFYGEEQKEEVATYKQKSMSITGYPISPEAFAKWYDNIVGIADQHLETTSQATVSYYFNRSGSSSQSYQPEQKEEEAKDYHSYPFHVGGGVTWTPDISDNGLAVNAGARLYDGDKTSMHFGVTATPGFNRTERVSDAEVEEKDPYYSSAVNKYIQETYTTDHTADKTTQHWGSANLSLEVALGDDVSLSMGPSVFVQNTTYDNGLSQKWLKVYAGDDQNNMNYVNREEDPAKDNSSYFNGGTSTTLGANAGLRVGQWSGNLTHNFGDNTGAFTVNYHFGGNDDSND